MKKQLVDIESGVNGVGHLFTEAKKGVAKIIPFKVSEKDSRFYNLRCMMNAHRVDPTLMSIQPGKYIKLFINDELMMSDTSMERKSNKEFITLATGRVLIAGLGIGLILHNILNKEDVKEVIVLELHKDVIDLVQPKFKSKKLKIIEGSIFDYIPQEKFDTIYFDIWPTICQDNLEDMKVLEKTFRKHLNKGGWLGSWMKKECQKLKRRDY